MPLYPSPENMTSLFEIITYGNSVTDSLLGTGIVFSLYLTTLLYVLGKNHNFGDAMVLAGFITVPIATLVFVAGLVNGYVLFVVSSLFVFSVFYNYIHKD